MAVQQMILSKDQLATYLEVENLKCRYFDTSLRMIDHLTKKYSEDELENTLSCTSFECEKILNYPSEAMSICS